MTRCIHTCSPHNKGNMKYSKHFNTKTTPQNQPIPGKNQVENNAGGYVFKVDSWKQLQRFLILGSSGGSYYVSEKKLTQENATAVVDCLMQDGIRTVNEIIKISDEGRAPKNDPAIFAMALAISLGNRDTQSYALNRLSQVCRTGTHLFQFVNEVQELRGWGSALRKGVSKWYTLQDPNKLALQLIKYRQRDGWTHKDVFRLASPRLNKDVFKTLDAYRQMKSLFRWVVDPNNFGPREVKRGGE
jgi:60 kDa SS-A/Ro ribonucleoprotein